MPSKHPILGALVEGVTLPRPATCISEAPHTGVRWLKELLYLIRQRIAIRSTTYWVRWLKERTGMKSKSDGGSTPYRVRWLKSTQQVTCGSAQRSTLYRVRWLKIFLVYFRCGSTPYRVRWLKVGDNKYEGRRRSTPYRVRWLKERTGMKSKSDGGSTPYRVRWLKNKAQGSEYDYVIEAPHTGCVG